MSRSLKFKLWCIYAMQVMYYVIIASMCVSDDKCIQAIGTVVFFHMGIPFLKERFKEEFEEEQREDVVK